MTASRQIAFQMDDPAGLRPATDTTLALIEEAQRRGYECLYYRPQDLSWSGAEVIARVRPITVDLAATPFYRLGEAHPISLHRVAMVWMRQEPPFDMGYITATHLLERLGSDTPVFNDPAGVRNAPEKLSPLAFPAFMPPTLISCDPEIIADFVQANREVVAKPLYGFGGHGVFKLRAGDPNIETLIEHWTSISREPLLWQEFRPEVRDSDKRVLLIDGEVASVFKRVPAADSIRANMRVGGTPQPCELTPRQAEICEAVAPFLRAEGLLLTGLDVIGDYLTEINVTCPTGLRASQWLYGGNLAATLWDKAEAKAAAWKQPA